MPATTPNLALTYPLGTDPIADGDDQIKALAQRLDGLVTRSAGGTLNVTFSNSADSASVAVTFPAGRFTAAPEISVVHPGGGPIWATAQTTSTSATVFGHRTTVATQTVALRWLAVQPALIG